MRKAAILAGVAALLLAAVSAEARTAGSSGAGGGRNAGGGSWSAAGAPASASGFASRGRPVPTTDSVVPDYATFSRPRTRTDRAWNYAWYGSVG